MRSQTVKATIAAAVAAIGLAACGHGLNHGVITGKQVIPAHFDTYWMSMYCGKGCYSMIPEQEYVPTEYVLDLKDGAQTGAVDVDQATWDKARIGTQYGSN